MPIYLIRHGEAEYSLNESNLTETGKQQVQHIGIALQKRQIKPTQIYYSPKLRAKATAEILASLLSPSPLLIEKLGIQPNDDPILFAEELNVITESVMVVSHLPFLPALVAQLTHGSAIEFTPATCVCLESPAPRQWKIAWHLKPQ